MPAYDFEHKETGETIRVICAPEEKMEELAKLVENVDDWLQRYSLNMSSSGGKTHMGHYTSEGFKDRLRAIKKANPGSTINV